MQWTPSRVRSSKAAKAFLPSWRCSVPTTFLNSQSRTSRSGTWFLLEGFCPHQGFTVVDVAVGASPAIGCKLSAPQGHWSRKPRIVECALQAERQAQMRRVLRRFLQVRCSVTPPWTFIKCVRCPERLWNKCVHSAPCCAIPSHELFSSFLVFLCTSAHAG